jgi:hypothetical protein
MTSHELHDLCPTESFVNSTQYHAEYSAITQTQKKAAPAPRGAIQYRCVPWINGPSKKNVLHSVKSRISAYVNSGIFVVPKQWFTNPFQCVRLNKCVKIILAQTHKKVCSGSALFMCVNTVFLI